MRGSEGGSGESLLDSIEPEHRPDALHDTELAGFRSLCALGRNRHSSGIPVDAHEPELANAGKGRDVLLGKPPDALRVFIGLGVQDELLDPLLFASDRFLTIVRRVVGDVDVPSPVAELSLENPSVGRFFEFRVPWFSLWPSSFHSSRDEVERLHEIYFGSTTIAAPGTGKDRKRVGESEKSLTGPVLSSLWDRWTGGCI